MQAINEGKVFFHQLSLLDLMVDDLSSPELPVPSDARCPVICSINMPSLIFIKGGTSRRRLLKLPGCTETDLQSEGASL